MSLRVWLPLTGTLENKGISNVTIENMGAVTANTAGKIGSCMAFTGTATSYLRIPAILSNTDCSIAFWAKLNSSSTAHTFYSQRVINNTTGFTIFQLSSGNLRFDDGGSFEVAGIGTGAWHHVVCCRDATKKYIYVDGKLRGSSSKNNVNPNVNYALIGGSQNNAAGTPSQGTTNALNGYLNDYRIYDHCLSAAEVKEISQGLVLHYKLDSVGAFNDNIISGTDDWSTWYKGSRWSAADGILTYTAGSSAQWIDADSPCIAWSQVENKTLTVSAEVRSDDYNYTTGSGFSLCLVRKASGPEAASYSNRRRECTPIYLQVNEVTSEWKLHSYTYPNFTDAEFTNTYSGGGGDWFGIYLWNHNNKNIQVRKIKVEIGGQVSMWTPAASDASYPSEGFPKIIQDSSGYGHNGTIINIPSIVNSEARYTSNIHFSANNQHIQLPAITYSNFGNSFTIAWWGKRSTHSNMMFWGFSNGNRLNGLYNGTLWNTGDGSNNPIYKPGTTTTIIAPTATSWHHYVMVGDGTKSQLYVDGVLYGEAKTYKGLTGTSIWINGWRNHTEYSSTDMDISDFRIYCTVLSADDILSLYHTAAKVDNLGGLHTFELNENGSNKLTKTGIFKDYMVEPFMTLADGSKWQLLLYHQVNNGTNLFTSSNAGFNNGFGLYSRLNYIDNFTYDSKYEFYVIQDGVVYRWTQTNAPLTTTSVTGFTAVTGSPGSGICKCNGNTLLAKTGTTSNWWNACGCWTIYNGGIPGFGSSVVCKQHLILYARISEPKFKIANLSVYANNLIER